MRLQVLLAALPTALLLPAVHAVFIDDAFRTDYHIPLVGFPRHDTTFFHQPFAESKASLIYTLSERNVLAAVNPKDGELVWRQALHGNGSEGFLRAGDGQDTVLSGKGDQVAAWSATDGKLAWSTTFGTPLVDLEILEMQDGAAAKGVKDALALSGGENAVVRRLDGETGAVKWEFTDNSGDKPYQVLASATGIYYISTHATKLSGLKIRVTVLDSVTGRKLDQYNLASENDFSETNSIIFAGANSAAPIIAWTDKAKKTFKLTILGDKKIAEYPIDAPAGETVTEINVHAPHRSNTVLRFLVHFATEKSHWASIYEINLVKKAVANVQNLPKAKGKAAYSISHIDANLFFTKITSNEMTVFSSTADAQTLGKWAIQSFSIPGLVAGKEEVYPLHTTAEVVVRDGSASAIRAAVLLSTGDWALVRNGEISWNRPEALAGATAAVWTEFDDAQDLADKLQAESHSNFVSAYIHRVLRHIGDLQHAPAWLQALPNRIIQSVLGLDTGADEKNSFGFAKRVVVATEKGRLIALDSGKAGNVLWNTQLTGLDQADLSAPLELTLDNEAKEILVRAKGKEEQIRVEAKTGAVLGSKPIDLSVSAGTVHYLVVDGELRGYLADKSKEPIWRFAPSSGKKIVSVTARPAEDPIASIGKVLGDRRVLYKYLNPNLIVVSAVSERGTASFYLLDSVSGKLLYEQTHKNVDTAEPITAEISENWFAYSFTTARTDATSEAPESHGIYLVIAELFESSIPNDRAPLGATANYSSLDLPEGVTPHVESQTYIIPEEISSMAVTHTRQGIASRLLLAVLPDSHSVVGIPRAVLDPRRPVGRDPNANEQAEGLARYTPSIEFDPKWYLNHKREVFGVQKVITSPAYLESTSLVFAFGLDVFGTRVAPSFAFDVLGKGFNKLQMLATVAALWAGVLFVAPLVRRKMINTRWQSVL